jgi:carbon monoxide dehydrogenase subunit G
VRLENTFEVAAPPEQAWDLLMDVPRVIPCMPGTELTETVDDGNWKAKMTVKLGPIGLQFATDVKREEADEAARRAVLSARAREMRGRGGGQATIESRLSPTGEGTRIDIVTELTLSGPVAQYGRGMVQDVSTALIRQFADCLAAKLAPAAAPAGADSGAAAVPPPEPSAVKPVGGLGLFFGVLGRRITRLFRRRSA